MLLAATGSSCHINHKVNAKGFQIYDYDASEGDTITLGSGISKTLETKKVTVLNETLYRVTEKGDSIVLFSIVTNDNLQTDDFAFTNTGVTLEFV